MKRIACWLRGHRERAFMLPEDLFGLYVYSRIECSRCGAVIAIGMDEGAQIAHLTTLLDKCRGAE